MYTTNLDSEIIIDASRVVTGSENDAAQQLPLSDDCGDGRGGQDAVLRRS